MVNNALTIWCSGSWAGESKEILEREAGAHRVLWAASAGSDEEKQAWLAESDVALGQVQADAIISSQRLRWVHITSAGYTPYDRDDVQRALRERGGLLTNSSHVYDEPCAQHVVAMMLALARQLPQAYDSQKTDHSWQTARRRMDCRLLNGETVLLLGYGAIGRRIAQLLAPFEVQMIALRRTPQHDDKVRVIGEDALDGVLSEADHVVNVLPENDATRGFVNTAMLAKMKRGVWLYNVGRGVTVEQDALLEALHSGQVGAAYLDVTTPEPLPAGHPLWTAPNCFITPHAAGGHAGEDLRLMRHFLGNLRAYERGEALADRVF